MYDIINVNSIMYDVKIKLNELDLETALNLLWNCSKTALKLL